MDNLGTKTQITFLSIKNPRDKMRDKNVYIYISVCPSRVRHRGKEVVRELARRLPLPCL